MEQTLGKRIMAARKKLGLTQDQLAERLGVTPQAVSKWENDQSCPDITMLPKLAEIFGITTDALLGRDPTVAVHEAEVVEDATSGDDNSFEIHLDSGRKSGIGFAILVLMVGGLMLANTLFDWGASFWDILWPSALVVFGWSGGFSFFRWACGVIGAAYLFGIIWDRHISSELVLPIILVIFGSGLLVDAFRKPKKPKFSVCHNGKPISSDGHAKNDYHIDGECFTYSASFGEQRQFISMPRLSNGDVSASFGEFILDLSGVDTIANGCAIEANCSFGELSLLIPSHFRVQCDSSTSFASVDIHGQPDAEPIGTILLHANASFGEIEVHYI